MVSFNSLDACVKMTMPFFGAVMLFDLFVAAFLHIGCENNFYIITMLIHTVSECALAPDNSKYTRKKNVEALRNIHLRAVRVAIRVRWWEI